MTHKIFIYLTFVLIAFASIVYGENNKRQNYYSQSEDIETFLSKFFSDAPFQIERIIFPLKGASYLEENPGEYSLQQSFNWKATEWKFVNYKLNYKNDQSDEKIINSLATQYSGKNYSVCKIKNGNKLMKLIFFIKAYDSESQIDQIYSKEFHFKLENNKWYLVFYITEKT